LETAKKLINKYGSKLVFPPDIVVASKNVLNKPYLDRLKSVTVVDFDNIPKNKIGFDIGPKAVKLFSAVLERSNTVIWNGPLGMFEYSPFNKSTTGIAKKLSRLVKDKGVHTIICGGDTASALKKTGYKQEMSFVSTGGGASLQLLAGKKLPAVEAVKK
jgi:phosphoglycerate kinase